jgi:hypothetical protein
LLVDPADAFHVARVEGILAPQYSQAFALELAVRLFSQFVNFTSENRSDSKLLQQKRDIIIAAVGRLLA